MPDTKPQTAAGKIVCHFSMTLDGFVAGPGHDMSWMTGFTGRPGLIEEYLATTGAVLGGRSGWDADPTARPYGGAWQGPIFVLTHHPATATPAPDVTFLNCPAEEAAAIALAAANGKNVEVLSPTITRQLLEAGVPVELDLHVAPVLLGDGIRLFDSPGAKSPILLHRVDVPDPVRELNLRYRPAPPANAD